LKNKMKKLNETYIHEETNITFDVLFEEKESTNSYDGLIPIRDKKIVKKVKINSSKNDYRNNNGFVFNRSNPETITKIGRALLEIGEFCEKL